MGELGSYLKVLFFVAAFDVVVVRVVAVSIKLPSFAFAVEYLPGYFFAMICFYYRRYYYHCGCWKWNCFEVAFHFLTRTAADFVVVVGDVFCL